MVSGQLDMDRLDYLGRDSFFTGVAEGVVGIDRIIKMLEIHDDQLVVESKGVYSIEKFLIARRLMYWQVYLHKTVLAADAQLINLLRRASVLVRNGENLHATPSFLVFLEKSLTLNDFIENRKVNGMGVIEHFMLLDDTDILSAVKVWQHHPDFILSYLAKGLIDRKLFAARILEAPLSQRKLKDMKVAVAKKFGISQVEADYLVVYREVSNSAYSVLTGNIMILDKHENLRDIRQASDINLSVLTKMVRKFFISYPKELVFN